MKVVINPAYSFLSDFINNLPDCFESDGDVIYEGRNTIKQFSIKNIDIAVKSFKVPLLVNRFTYTYFRKSKAARSYYYAFEIKRRGFLTPDPIAYVETYKGGLFKGSYFVSVYDSASETVRSLMAGENVPDAENKLRSFAFFTAALHEAEIYHIDYSPGNVLIKNMPDNTYQFSLIDINRMHFKSVSKEEALKNLDRMCLSRRISSDIARYYAQYKGWNAKNTADKVNNYSDHFFELKAFSFARKKLKRSKGICYTLFGPILLYQLLCKFRVFFLNGKSKGRLYIKETDLYNKYIHESDVRGVLQSKYNYPV